MSRSDRIRHPRTRTSAAVTSAAVTAALLLAGACAGTSDTGASGASGGGASTPGSGAGATTPGGSPTSAGAEVEPVRRDKPTKVASPTLAGPITGGAYGVPFNPLTTSDATKYGYEEQEYFLSGVATSYAPDGTWGEDGRWTATEAATAPFTTRMSVRLPTDPAKFNGTVVVEWRNVSSGMDADPDFGFTHDLLLREGYGYIGVSAQKAGIDAGGVAIPIPGFDVKAAKEWDPERYADLSHPGDEFSYDIFSQAGAVAWNAGSAGGDDGGGGTVDPFDGYDVTQVLAAGESQSSFRLVTYVNAVHPIVRLYDGFLIHSRNAKGAPIAADAPETAPAVHIRSDLEEPVFQLQAETDLFGLGFYPARQPDTPMLRTWEIAGTAHADQFTLDYGVESGREWEPDANIDFDSMCGKLNSGPQTFVARSAVASLRAWAAGGPAPATSPRIDVDTTSTPPKIARDEHGNAKGGIRTAAVDVPIAVQSGDPGPAASVICSLFGHSIPFTDDVLRSLYPSRSDYVAKVRAATSSAVAAGFVLPDDESEIIAAAEAAPIP